MFEQLGLIGCGLMGGSFALALKRAGLVKRVVGYSKSPSTTERARQMGVIDVEAPSALLAVSGADIVLIAVPVAATEATFKAIKHLVTPKMLIMDVGSTKRDVIDAGRRALRRPRELIWIRRDAFHRRSMSSGWKTLMAPSSIPRTAGSTTADLPLP